MENIFDFPIVGRMPIFTKENRALIRSGKKTQTRRVIKPQPEEHRVVSQITNADGWWEVLPLSIANGCVPIREVKHRYGSVGDYRVMPEPVVYAEDEMVYYGDSVLALLKPQHVTIDGRHADYRDWDWKSTKLSSMFMPTHFGRTFVKYIDIRVERLQDISEEDAKAEGAPHHLPSAILHKFDAERIVGHKLGFCNLWNSINGKKYPWESNPWVWVIEWELI